MDYNIVTKELLRYLEETFPDKVPPYPTDSKELAFIQGQLSVVQRLTQLYEDDNGWTNRTSNS